MKLISLVIGNTNSTACTAVINMTSTASSIELILCVLYHNLISIECAIKVSIVEEKICKVKKRIDHMHSVMGMQMLCKMPAREVHHNRKTPKIENSSL